MKVTQQPIKTEKMNGGKKEAPVKKPVTLLKTLYNNEACLTASKTFPVWVSLLFLLGAMGISIIPATVNTASTRGDALLTGTNYSLDIGMEEFTKDLGGKVYDSATNTTTYDTSKEVNFVVKSVSEVTSDGYTTYNKLVLEDATNWNNLCKTETITLSDGSSKEYQYYSFSQTTGDVDTSTGTAVSLEKFRVFFVEDSNKGEEKAYNFFMYDEVFGVKSSLTSDNASYRAPVSTLVLGSTSFYLVNYKTGSTDHSSYNGSIFGGDYLRVSETTYLKDLLHAADDTDNSGALVSLVESKWCNFFQEGYKTINTKNTWIMFGIVGGMNTVISVLFGFLLWVMTRGKKNPNRDLKVLEGFKMAFFASLAPAILTLIVGFVWSQFAMLAYVALMSIRLMWMSMKTLRPNAQ